MPTILIEASGLANFEIFEAIFSLYPSSFISISNLLLNKISASFSTKQIAASKSEIALALWYWWSSATFGEGIKMDGFPTIASSERVKAPLLAIIISEE